MHNPVTCSSRCRASLRHLALPLLEPAVLRNTETIADAKQAQEAVKNALAVLKEFYAKAAEATALMQARGGTAT